MKTNNLFYTVLCFIALSCILSCSNDDEPSEDVNTKTFRVKEITSFYTDNNAEIYDDKSILFYNNERLTEIIEYEKENGIWEEEYKSELIYDGDWVAIIDFDKEGDIWVENENWNMRMKIVNGRIEITESNSDSNVHQTVFNYTGDKLISIQEYYDGINDYKMEFSYNGDNLQETIEYYNQDGTWQAIMKLQYSYLDGKLTQSIGSYFNNEDWQNSEKYEYEYLIDKLVTIYRYSWNEGNWDEHDSQTDFEYNNEGLLVSQRETYWDGNSWGQKYLYEEGQGNLKLFMDINYYNYNYPTPQKPAGKVKAFDAPNNKQFINKYLLNRLLN